MTSTPRWVWVRSRALRLSSLMCRRRRSQPNGGRHCFPSCSQPSPSDGSELQTQTLSRLAGIAPTGNGKVAMGRVAYMILVRGLPRADRQDWVTCAGGLAAAIVAVATYSML